MSPIARFKDWCIDAVDTGAVATFWAGALGLDARPHARRDVVGLWRGDEAVIWVNRVDHPKVVKDRVHPDLTVPSIDRLTALGARVLAEHGAHVVLADPEGHEMCAFPAEAPAEGSIDDPPARVFALCVDSADPVALAAWWAEVTGARLGPGPDGTPRYLHDVPGLGDLVWKVVPVDDERVGENRVHWDVEGDVDALEAAGATVVRRPDDDIVWTVMRDPQGNVFCVG